MKFLLIQEHYIAAALVACASFVGHEISFMLAALPPTMPDWFTLLAGPIGSFVFMLGAIAWLLQRLAKKELAEIRRQDQRDAMLMQMAESNLRVALALEKNSDALNRNSKYLELKDAK